MPDIIVATDGSPSADRAVDAAAELAKATGSGLIILTVGGNLSGEELRQLAGAEGDLSKELEMAANKILEAARKRALQKGLSNVTLRSGWGDPAENIIDTIQRENADLLVIGRRGHSRLSGLLLGSISQKMTSLAPCRVMVVP
jgi:nucleotide-binding universal stress UspA family protein